MANKLHHESIYRGKETMQKIRGFDLLICGAGALGSNLAVNLARAGFGNITVVDRDRVEEQNVGTQVYSLDDVGGLKADILSNMIYRECGEEVKAISQELSERNVKKILANHQLVVDSFDNTVSRGLITEFCKTNDIACLHAGVNNHYGEVRWNEHYIVPNDGGEDICDYPLARNLIMMVAAIAGEVVMRFASSNVKENYCITLKDLQVTREDF